MRNIAITQFRLTVAALATLALAACSSAQVSSINVFDSGGGKPDRVVVGAIVVPPGSVSLDASIAAKLRRRANSEDAAMARQRLTSEVSSVLTQRVVERLTRAGLPATSGLSTMERADSRVLLIDGSVTEINEGNRMRRNVIGFGAGKSQVSADVTVSMADTSGRKQLMTFRAEADSGRRPGAVATAPVSAARGAAAVGAAAGAASSVVSEKLRADVEALAKNLGDAIADKVIDYAVSQGWIAKAA
jgi:hypothetical protein